MIKISVITAVYNNEETIEDAIVSVQNQTYSNIQHIIVDGNSSDNSLDIINKKIRPEDILISENDNGVYNAFNKGIKLATGDYICFLHSDDVFYDNNVLEQIAQELSVNNIDVVYSDLIYVYKNNINKIFRHWKSSIFHVRKLKFGWMAPHPTLIIKKEVYDRIGLFDEQYRISADYDFIIRLFKSDNLSVKYLSRITYRMRIGGVSNNKLSNIILKLREDYSIIKKNNFYGLFTLLCKNVSKLKQFHKYKES